MKLSISLPALTAAASLLLIGCSRAEDAKPKTPTATETKPMDTKQADKVVKTDEEWRKTLTPEQYRILRTAGTEPPHGEKYEEFNKQGEGTYYCAGCGAELFTSNEKFHSGCGWPSFYDQSKAKGVLEKPDNSHGMRRIEVVCKKCDGHLGHVFEKEGYKTPTDRRFCINAESLKFVPGKAAAPDKAKATEPEKK